MDKLKHGRESYRRRAWSDAYRSLARADEEDSLRPEDLERLAKSAYLLGRQPDFQRFMDRAHRAHLQTGDRERAALCAFWLGLNLLLRGEMGQATGWLGRSRRLIEDRDCVEQGYVLLPVAEKHLARGDAEQAYTTGASASEIGNRFEDADLIAMARHLQGRALIRQGRVEAGLAFLDETMVSVVSGELSPVVTGLIYCSVIEACSRVYAVSRAQEWTSALGLWCDRQPDMVAFTRTCLVYRAEIMKLHGAWPDAMAEADRACEQASKIAGEEPPAAAFYQQAEVYRLRGEFGNAEEAYEHASRLGYEPQPGLALLWLAQGQIDAASAAVERLLGSTNDPLERAKLLPAQAEIMLTVDEVEKAGNAARELEDIAERFDTGVLEAMAAHARGAVELAEGDAKSALVSLRRAFETWKNIKAPYEAARIRVLMGRACIALGDHRGGMLELEAAREVFERLGASPELSRLEALAEDRDRTNNNPRGLTSRQMEVLRLVAAGKTNKEIAAELYVSERTIDRHVSNILGKLDVPTRAAATAYAYEHNLL